MLAAKGQVGVITPKETNVAQSQWAAVIGFIINADEHDLTVIG
jgi:hypothetical protein